MKRISAFLIFSLLINRNCDANTNKSFICDSTHLKIWNGDTYVPYPIKGVNFGVAVPGTFPVDLLVSRQQYGNWLAQIQHAGFNTLRLYTLHFPDFYEVLDSFNIENPHSPLFIMQGVWLEEDAPGYSNNLFTLTQTFQTEIEDNINCIHGNNTIPLRSGKAYGVYTRDISKWVSAYIIGREVMPIEVITSNQLNASINSFNGIYYSISNCTPVEAWVAAQLNHLCTYENANYGVLKPLSFSSWPTLDPLPHPAERDRNEDTASIDLASLHPSVLSAGYFVSYHAYPYFPDFISHQQSYQGCSDFIGPNSYICYLEELKLHYPNFPLLIAETGCPSSWGIAHYAQNGIHHGGFDESDQGWNNMRLAENIMDAGCAGSFVFNWMDEWFKRTWITDFVDSVASRRVLWHNVTAAEQNFGLLGFKSIAQPSLWKQFPAPLLISSIYASADYAYFTMRLHMNPPGVLDTISIAIDTYDPNLGESILPNGSTVTNRAEFYLHITNYEAKLYVTEAYDLYGARFGGSSPGQVYKSVLSNGSPWNIVRWQNNDTILSTQYIGDMQVNRLNPQLSSLDAVRIDSTFIDIRIPWTLLNFSDPTQMKVVHDINSIPAMQDTSSSGISVKIFYAGEEYTPTSRFSWPTWNAVTNVQEYLKESYTVIQNNMYQLPGGPVAFTDSFLINTSTVFSTPATAGLLKNDFLLSGFNGLTYLDTPPSHGLLYLASDGSFSFYPDTSFAGVDTFSYQLLNGPHMSEPAKVFLHINTSGVWASIYPNPANGPFTISSLRMLDKVEIYNNLGKCIYTQVSKSKEAFISHNFKPGIYFARVYSGDKVMNKKFIIEQ